MVERGVIFVFALILIEPGATPGTFSKLPADGVRGVGQGAQISPMAKTYAYALAGGLIATFTVTPALSAYLLPDKVTEKEDRRGR